MPHNVAVYYSRRQRLHTLLNRKSASRVAFWVRQQVGVVPKAVKTPRCGHADQGV